MIDKKHKLRSYQDWCTETERILNSRLRLKVWRKHCHGCATILTYTIVNYGKIIGDEFLLKDFENHSVNLDRSEGRFDVNSLIFFQCSPFSIIPMCLHYIFHLLNDAGHPMLVLAISSPVIRLIIFSGRLILH